MAKKIVVYTTLVCLLGSMPLGCYSTQVVHLGETSETYKYVDLTIRGLVTNDGEVIEFAREDAPKLHLTTTVIAGTASRRSQPAEGGGWTKPKRIPMNEREFCEFQLEDVRTLYLEKTNAAGTVVAVIAVTVVVLVVAAGIACANSEPHVDVPDTAFTCCPLVHSFDGERYVLEGIPYVGSMCAALERTDVLPLEHLVPIGDEYLLLVTNDALETENIDELSLIVADHDPDVQLAVDARGGLHTVEARQQPVSVRDQNDVDWHQWLKAKDLLFWEGDPFSMDPEGKGGLRDTLFFKFQRPTDADRAKLLISGGHSTWASGIEYELLNLWGSDIGSFYRRCEDPDYRERFFGWLGREEITSLAVRVKTHDGWRVADRVAPDNWTGSSEQLAVVDLRGVVGETLEVALTPPAGLWRVNAVTADFSDDRPFSLTEVAVGSAVGPHDEDAAEALTSDDGFYLTMPEKGMATTLRFPVPESSTGQERTVFLRATGHYDIHFDADWPARVSELERLEREPGYAAVLTLRYHRERSMALAGLVDR